jgi:hypothetical protein
MASVPKVEYLTAAELVAKLEELTKDKPGYAAEVKRMGEIYGWTVEFGMRFTCFLAAALIIGLVLASKNTGLDDYKKALEQKDKLRDLFANFINSSDFRQFLKIPEGDVSPDMISIAIDKNMQREVNKREIEEDTRVK